MIAPPINAKVEGLSLTNKKAQTGPKTDSDNIIIPTIADGVVLAPMVINIKPNPTWKKPAKKPKKISFDDTIIVGDNNKPINIANIPATSCKGIMSTSGYFLTINIKIAKEIGIINATRFPVISPGEIELPSIKIMPEIASKIQKKVSLEIVSFKKKYPKIAKNKVCVWIIKFVLATVVSYIANT